MAGNVTIELSNYVNNKKPETTEKLFLQKCPDEEANITFTMKIIFLGQIESPKEKN